MKATELPKLGETYTCLVCGMAFVITAPCGCTDPSCVTLKCCDQDMSKQAAKKP